MMISALSGVDVAMTTMKQGTEHDMAKKFDDDVTRSTTTSDAARPAAGHQLSLVPV